MSPALKDRLAQLDTIELEHGDHEFFDDGMCAMEAVAWLAGEECTDAPQCACPIIARAMQRLNDLIDDKTLRTQLLLPLLARIVDSRVSSEVMVKRAFIATDTAVRIFSPIALEKRGFVELAATLRRIPAIVNSETALAAKQTVSNVVKDVTRANAASYAAVAAADASYAAVAAAAATAATVTATATDAAVAAANAAATATAASLAAQMGIYTLGVEMIERMLLVTS